MRNFKALYICAHQHCIRKFHLLAMISSNFQVLKTSWKLYYRYTSVVIFFFFKVKKVMVITNLIKSLLWLYFRCATYIVLDDGIDEVGFPAFTSLYII
jgi:hypothetical protein